MATVKTIIPCICSNQDVRESIFDGMPQLTVSCGTQEHRQFWSAFCPNCGRGSKLDDFNSPYLALKHWNKLQETLRKTGSPWQDSKPELKTDEELEY